MVFILWCRYSRLKVDGTNMHKPIDNKFNCMGTHRYMPQCSWLSSQVIIYTLYRDLPTVLNVFGMKPGVVREVQISSWDSCEETADSCSFRMQLVMSFGSKLKKQTR